MPNIITSWPLSGAPLEDALKGMKRFNQIFVVEKEDRNKIIRGVTRESKHHKIFKWVCGNYCWKLTVATMRNSLYLVKGPKVGKGRNQRE